MISPAWLGIRPELGFDQAGGFLAQARRLAVSAGLDLRLLEADIRAALAGVGRFDPALIPNGVLNWMPDLPGFIHGSAGLLAPGGRPVIHETYPILEVFGPQSDRPFAPGLSYFERRSRQITEAITYDGRNHGESEPGYWFIPRRGEIVAAWVQAGPVQREIWENGHGVREAEYEKYEGRAVFWPVGAGLRSLRAGGCRRGPDPRVFAQDTTVF